MAKSGAGLERFHGGHWAVPAYLPYVQPPLTADAVSDAEAQLAVTLSPTYLELLYQQNGGFLRGAWGVSYTLSGIGPAFPSIIRDDAWWRPANANSDIWAPRAPELLIPFDGDGHWDVCFDYRVCGPRGEPSITYVSCESEVEEPLAETFDMYLASLTDTLAEHCRVYGAVTPETVARGIAEQCGGGEVLVDDFAHGYSTWRVALPGKSQWCWCSPNRVPAGFRREGQRRVVRTEATALRLPEDSECQVLLSCSGSSEPIVVAAVDALELVAKWPAERGRPTEVR